MTKTKVRHIVVVTYDCGDEAIYVDRKLAYSSDTVFACDIAEVAKDLIVTLTHECRECHDNEPHFELTLGVKIAEMPATQEAHHAKP